MSDIIGWWKRRKVQREERERRIRALACHYLRGGRYTIDIAMYSARRDIEAEEERPKQAEFIRQHAQGGPS